MNAEPSPSGDLDLSHVLEAAGVDPADVLIIRHTYSPQGLRDAQDVTVDRVRHYVREQKLGAKFPKTPPRLWLNFIADGGRRARYFATYENTGEATGERNDVHRYYHLVDHPLLSSLSNRLVVEWTADTINWAKAGHRAAGLPVVEIADPEVVRFPGFDSFVIGHSELRAVISDARYGEWRTALRSVQGVYLIADTSTGKLYVGKADGGERIFARWSAYARDGHGGNIALRELDGVDPEHREHFQFSILRVFDPGATRPEIDAAEAHFKRALLSRDFGLNRN